MGSAPALTIRLEIGLDPELQEYLQAWFAYKSPNPALDRIMRKVDEIMSTQAEITAALDKIDAATTKIGSNVQIVADGLQTISGEVDALKTALEGAGVPQALVDRAAALSARVQAASNTLDAQVPVLIGIAAKGAVDPVPVPPPPPPPVEPPAIP